MVALRFSEREREREREREKKRPIKNSKSPLLPIPYTMYWIMVLYQIH